MKGAETPEFQSKLVAAMMYHDERTLAGGLEVKTYNKLESFMASRQIPIANFSRFQPWAVSLIISMMEYQRLGMMPNYGVDVHFNTLALADNKEIVSLETLDEQLSFISAMANVKLI